MRVRRDSAASRFSGSARNESGIEKTVLQATPQGSHLYLRMGYRIVTKFSIFMREGCLFLTIRPVEGTLGSRGSVCRIAGRAVTAVGGTRVRSRAEVDMAVCR